MEVDIDKKHGGYEPTTMALSTAINPTWKQTKDTNQLHV